MNQFVWWGHLTLTLLMTLFLVLCTVAYNGMRCYHDHRTQGRYCSHPLWRVIWEIAVTLAVFVVLMYAWHGRHLTLYLCASLPVWMVGFALMNHLDHMTHRSMDPMRALRLLAVFVTINVIFCSAA